MFNIFTVYRITGFADYSNVAGYFHLCWGLFSFLVLWKQLFVVIVRFLFREWRLFVVLDCRPDFAYLYLHLK